MVWPYTAVVDGGFKTYPMFLKIFNAYRRKRQLAVLKNHPQSKLGSIKIGDEVKFILDAEMKQMSVGKSVNFRDNIHILVQRNASLVIEDRVFLNNFCSVNCLDQIFIGENTLFGENVKLYDHNHEYSRESGQLTVQHSRFKTAPIYIGKNCWLGSNVTVLKGVSIGDNCIIGAGCVIHKNVPPNTTVLHRQDLIFNAH